MFEEDRDAQAEQVVALEAREERRLRDARENVDRKEAALTRAMALANPAIVAMAEATWRVAGTRALPSYRGRSDDDLLKIAGRAAISGVSRAFFRGIAEGQMTDAFHASLLELVRTIAGATNVGHGSLEREP